VNVRRFGGMKVERTWFAVDKTGFHMLHTLFQTSMKYSNINRLDEYFVVDLIVDDGEVQGLYPSELKMLGSATFSLRRKELAFRQDTDLKI
jgi:succinate dehydrogenase/fumarate reductase flavoprotein subunit